MNRRNFVKAGVLAGMSTSLLNAAVDPTSARKCVFIYLGGGISHIEFINPISDSPIEFRSVTDAVTTKHGYQLGGSFSNLAGCSELFTTVRSFSHRDANHHSAAHWVNTGRSAFNIGDNGASTEPSYGALLCHEFSPNAKNGMPHYVKVNQTPHDDAAWLGPKYMGYDNDAEATKNLRLGVSRDKFEQRVKMLDTVNRGSVKMGKNSQMFKDWEDIRNLAIDVVSGDVSKAFDVSLEPESSRLAYKEESSGFGRSLLQARRLLENNCKYITIANNGWDMHSDIKAGFDKQAGELDWGLATFLKDLKDRGLLEDTLVVVTSEFGRTPKLNAGIGSGIAGRDHYPHCNSLILAGGSYGGSLIGETDKTASSIISSKFSPEDLAWTILNHFEVEKSLVIADSQKRPRHILDKEAKLIL